MNKNNLKKIHVVCAVIVDNGKVFATQRGYGEFKDGWEFPGGKVEKEETPEQAVVREIREELDAEIQVDAYFDAIEYDYPEFHLSMKCYLCHVRSGSLKLLEHEAAKWLDRDSLNSVDWLPADLMIIEKLKKFLSQLQGDNLSC